MPPVRPRAEVWGTGNVPNPVAHVPVAATAGAAINGDLVVDDTRHAVDDLRPTAASNGVSGETQRVSSNVNDGLIQQVQGLPG